MIKYPMKLIPVPREMIWGSDRLKTKFNKTSDFEKLGESWELTIRPEAQSIIGNGIYEGKRLSDIINCANDFPLLIKFIDSGDKLSVQVHPDDNITDEYGTPLGKTEMWYILEADEEAHLIYGINSGITKEEFASLVKEERAEDALQKIKVKVGDCFFIPAGLVHAIGKGIVLCEIQQNSDTTYRLYDYARLDKNGLPRQLHIEEALNVIKLYSNEDIEAIRYSDGNNPNCLANCDKFEVYLENIPSKLLTENSFTALIFIEGSGEIIHSSDSYTFTAGDTFYIPEETEIELIGEGKYIMAKPK